MKIIIWDKWNNRPAKLSDILETIVLIMIIVYTGVYIVTHGNLI